jgi:hypothetical protein
MKLAVSIKHQLDCQDILNIIIYILISESFSKKISRKFILRILKDYLFFYGKKELTQDTFSASAEIKKKADSLGRKHFPELFKNELNCVNYIKSLEE